MKLVKPSALPSTTGEGTAVPQNRAWLQEWIENKGQWVLLECGHKEDLTDRGLTILKAFKKTTVGCERCNRFVAVAKHLKTKNDPVKSPDEPLF